MKEIDKYDIVADAVPAKIRILQHPTENIPTYEILMPELSLGTKALTQELVDELSLHVPLEMDNMADPQHVAQVKQKFLQKAQTIVSKRVPDLSDAEQKTLCGILLHRMYGLGFVDVIMADNWVEELTINGSKQPVSLFHKKHGWVKTNQYLKDEEEIRNLSAQIGRKVNREITTMRPIMDAHLLSGDRVSSTLFPISTAGNTITIRRFSRNPWTPISFLETGTTSVEVMAFLWQAMQFELNILTAGGTASGKTSMLNSICAFIPQNQRVITIEDTREIQLPEGLHWNWVPMTSRPANPEGEGEITMLDLLVSTLRMRPDRIVVGEVRRREQMEAMFEAMHTGHSVYCTMHADTVYQVKRRLTEPPIQIPEAEVEALQLILIQYRDRQTGRRRTLELAEVLRGAENGLELNYLYRWHPRTDTFEKVNQSIRVVEDLNLHTGMTIPEIENDLKEKELVLTWLNDQNIKQIDDFGHAMKLYYRNKDELLQAIKAGKKFKEVFDG